MDVGKQIRESRKQAHLTQAELAEMVGVAEITIRQYEAGKRKPSMAQIEKLASALGVLPTTLIGWEEAVTSVVEQSISGEPLTSRLLPTVVETNDEQLIALIKATSDLTEEDKGLLVEIAHHFNKVRGEGRPQ